MHPIIANQTATEMRQRRLQHAATRRRLALARHASSSTPAWRVRQAARLVALARRLDPGAVGSRPAVLR